MPKLTIDHREVEVSQGATVLEAVRRLGIDVPALCYHEGCDASTSCLVCLVRINGSDRLVPSCATAAAEGMQVESETEAVHSARRTALELLLSDHLGDCVAPCQFGCPAEMDIPAMLRQIVAGDMREAIVTVKRDIALPAVLGRICPAPCEKVCRRGDLDSPVSICRLKRLVADVDLASGASYMPTCQAATGKRVAIVGAGPTGLSAAYYLRQLGHACTLFERQPHAGGRLIDEMADAQIPRDVLEAEIAMILRLGIDLQAGKWIGPDSELCSRYDAVLLACGTSAPQQVAGWKLDVGPRGIVVQARTYETNVQGIFAAGGAIRGKTLAIRSVADGKEAATAIDQYLCGLPVTGAAKAFSTKIGRMHGDELASFAAGAMAANGQGGQSDFRGEGGTGACATAGLTMAEGVEQAAHCLHCDCRGASSCKLRKYAALYHAQPRRFKADRRPFEQDARHAEVIYEPGKCIACGLCIQIAAAAGEPLGLTLVGRGFDVRVAVPLDRPLSEALTKAAAQCIAACPTAALAWKSS